MKLDYNENEYEMYDLYNQNRQGVVFHPWGWWFFFPPHMMPPPPRPPYPPRPPRPPGPPGPPSGPPPRPQPREYM